MTIKVFSVEGLDLLVTQAKNSPRLRQHKNIHLDYADPCQRLFNSIEPDSYIRPHLRQHYVTLRLTTTVKLKR
jgi:cupin fold WbuC family metalloprotein